MAALLALLLMAPFVASVTHAVSTDWIPSGDDGLIGMRAFDVFSSDAPLTGQPSTSHLYDEELPTAHPGPIEFYAMAVPVRIFGPSLGMLLTIGAINMSAILLAAWVIYRRAGPRVGLWGAVVLSGVAWAEGSFELSDPISSNAGGISLVALAVLCWAVVDGDNRLLPVTALVASWVVQQHLAIVTPAAALALWGGIGLAVLLWRHVRAGRAAGLDWSRVLMGDRPAAAGEAPDGVTARATAGPADDAAPETTGDAVQTGGPPGGATDRVAGIDSPDDGDAVPQPADHPRPVVAAGVVRSPTVIASEPEGGALPWLIGGLAVLLFCSLPMLIEQFGPSGNMASIVQYARDNERPSLGWAAGARQSLRAFGIPPLLVQSDFSGDDMKAPLSPFGVASGIAVIAALVAIIVVARRRRPPLAALAVTALVLAAAGTFAGSKIPESIEAGRINFYRWTFVVAVCTWVALGWAAGLLYRRYGPPLPAVASRLAPFVAVAVVLVASVAAVTGDGPDDVRRDEAGRQVMNAVADEMMRLAEGHDRVTVLINGASAGASVGPAAVLQLMGEGHDVQVPGQEDRFWGENRAFDPDDDPGLVLMLSTRRGPVLDGQGRLTMRFELNPELNEALRVLVDPVMSGRLAVTDPEGVYDEKAQDLFAEIVDEMEARPVRALINTAVLALLLDKVPEGSREEEALKTVERELPGDIFVGDDTFEVRVLTADELRNNYPHLYS